MAEAPEAQGMTQDIFNKLRRRIESGILFTASAYINNWLSERLARRFAKEYAELAVGLGSALAADFTGLAQRVRQFDVYLEYLMDGMSDYGIMKTALDYKIAKKPLCFFQDANTIACINFDVDTVAANKVTVLVDDASVSVSSTSGSPASFTISLANPVAKGWHKLVVIAGDAKKDAFRGKVYTP